jgi:hypothetical protein
MFLVSDRPIDFEDAIIVMSHFQHGGYDEWYIRDQWAEPRHVAAEGSYDEFEAIAIAEKYLRNHAIRFRVLSSERTHSESEANASAVWHIKIVNPSPSEDLKDSMKSKNSDASSS